MGRCVCQVGVAWTAESGNEVMFFVVFFEGDDTDNKFRINAESGLIETTASTLDRETRDLYRLVVAVTDSGTPSRMVTVQEEGVKLALTWTP